MKTEEMVQQSNKTSKEEGKAGDKIGGEEGQIKASRQTIKMEELKKQQEKFKNYEISAIEVPKEEIEGSFNLPAKINETTD
mmetsp:Transcript_38/g.71  ORF Transcript_38/g.71 Transcript_38/m.71 type:complete len:81 (-) Transcript_38:976-1218(-)